MDREQELSWPQSFLPAATQGRALGAGGGLSRGGDGSAWGSAWTRTLARPAGVSPALRTESHPGRAKSDSLGQRPATVPCRHSQAGGQEETGSGPWKPATRKEGKEPKAGGVSPPCWAHSAHEWGGGGGGLYLFQRRTKTIRTLWRLHRQQVAQLGF